MIVYPPGRYGVYGLPKVHCKDEMAECNLGGEAESVSDSIRAGLRTHTHTHLGEGLGFGN